MFKNLATSLKCKRNPDLDTYRETYLWIILNIFFCFVVNKLKQEADVMINIPDDRASSNCIRIEGNKDGVSMAKEVSYSKIDKK